MQDLAGRTAMVTGGAAGIGRATAQALAARGARVVIADLDGTAASVAAAALGPSHLGIGCDVADEASVAAALAAAGTVDILVNNAGIGDVNRPTTDQDAAHFRRLLDIHLTGAFVISREVARGLLAAGRSGTIVNLASIAALTGLPRRNAYGAAKAGLVALTRALACEWAGAGIRVNAVAPGYVATDLVRALIRDGLLDADRIRRRMPIGRMIEPAEVAAAIVFLASDQASAITGTVLTVDGGWTAYGAAEDAVSGAASS